MDCRGFETPTEMNEYMISQWNSHVTDQDEVYILGDLSVGKGKATNAITEQLKGKLHLIIGNHDDFLSDKQFDTDRFEWIKPYAEIYDGRRKVILSHYPVFCYNAQYRLGKDGLNHTYMLYGHVHNTPDEALIDYFQQVTRNTKRHVKGRTEPQNIPCHMINCFCMFSDYVPLSLDSWIRTDNERRANALETEIDPETGGLRPVVQEEEDLSTIEEENAEKTENED